MGPRKVAGKIFGIGFHRTGTRSLAAVLAQHGYTVKHWPKFHQDVDFEELVRPLAGSRLAVVAILAPVIDCVDAVLDVPIPALYRELAEAYPDSKFIMVRRDLDEWWSSVLRHKGVGDKQREVSLDPFELLMYRRYGDSDIVTVSEAQEQDFKRVHRTHWREVASYFAEQPTRLLDVELSDPHLAEKIAAFVNSDNSSVEFPHIT